MSAGYQANLPDFVKAQQGFDLFAGALARVMLALENQLSDTLSNKAVYEGMGASKFREVHGLIQGHMQGATYAVAMLAQQVERSGDQYDETDRLQEESLGGLNKALGDFRLPNPGSILPNPGSISNAL